MADHRKVAIPHSAAPQGHCRWCGNAILKPDGSPNLRRSWHPECLAAYQMSWPGVARDVVYGRDRGVCAACRADTHRWCLTKSPKVHVDWGTFRSLGYREIIEDVRVGAFCDAEWSYEARWELDHIVPLIDGGTHELANMQTLCRPCHRAKTAGEARERALRRKPLPLFGAVA